MTAKMLSRQAAKAHKESEAQKAKVKKVDLPSSVGGIDVSRLYNKEITILQGFMQETLLERNRNVSIYYVFPHVLTQLLLVSAQPSQ
jgi:hypothetical protein